VVRAMRLHSAAWRRNSVEAIMVVYPSRPVFPSTREPRPCSSPIALSHWGRAKFGNRRG
jgi:hypothetical protein